MGGCWCKSIETTGIESKGAMCRAMKSITGQKKLSYTREWWQGENRVDNVDTKHHLVNHQTASKWDFTTIKWVKAQRKTKVVLPLWINTSEIQENRDVFKHSWNQRACKMTTPSNNYEQRAWSKECTRVVPTENSEHNNAVSRSPKNIAKALRVNR